ETKKAAKQKKKRENKRMPWFGKRQSTVSSQGGDSTAAIETKEISVIAETNRAAKGGGLSSSATSSIPKPDDGRHADPDEPAAAKFGIPREMNLQIARGELVAIVGPVGSGKSSLLNALVSEMRKNHGSITFGGTVGYCPQTAWIQNTTVRDNI